MASHDYRKVSVQKEYTYTRGVIDEEEFGTPADLPIGAYPGTPQYTFTITDSNLPIFAGDVPYAYKAVGFFGITVENNTGASVDVFVSYDINDVNVHANSLTVPDTNYGNMKGSCFDVQVGDHIDVYVYATAGSIKLLNQYGFVLPSSVIPDLRCVDIEISNFYLDPDEPDFTIGAGAANEQAQYGNRYAFGDDLKLDVLSAANFTMTARDFTEGDTGIYKLGTGDYAYPNLVQATTSTVACPYYTGNSTPHTVRWRKLK